MLFVLVVELVLVVESSVDLFAVLATHRIFVV